MYQETAPCIDRRISDLGNIPIECSMHRLARAGKTISSQTLKPAENPLQSPLPRLKPENLMAAIRRFGSHFFSTELPTTLLLVSTNPSPRATRQMQSKLPCAHGKRGLSPAVASLPPSGSDGSQNGIRSRKSRSAWMSTPVSAPRHSRR